jgi:hypothetical protein
MSLFLNVSHSAGGCHLKEEQTTRFVFEVTPTAFSHADTTE